MSINRASCGFGFRNNIIGVLLLNGLFHADGVDHQFKVFKDLWLLAPNKGFDGFIGEQFGEIAQPSPDRGLLGCPKQGQSACRTLAASGCSSRTGAEG